MKQPPLRTFRAENFKAIRDSGTVRFGWLTAFIGNNGVGKSSFIEALETFRDVVVDDVDSAFRRWRGFEYVWNQSQQRKLVERPDHRAGETFPMRFHIRWNWRDEELNCQQAITRGPGGESLFIQQEKVIQRRGQHTSHWNRNDAGQVLFQGWRAGEAKPDPSVQQFLEGGQSLLRRVSWQSFERWLFLMLIPERMGYPTPRHRAARSPRLAKDGSNVAEYLQGIRDLDLGPWEGVFEGLVDALRHVLPYADELEPILTSEVERACYLNLREQSFVVPGWLLSTGTLRIVALLACLRHPNPPPVLIVEEIENGLDPRTLHLLVAEIRAAITAGTTQVILTTHSPYLLDLLDLSHIVVVEREDGQPVFRRPDAEQLTEWSKSFSPGRLYTMGRLTRGDQ